MLNNQRVYIVYGLVVHDDWMILLVPNHNLLETSRWKCHEFMIFMDLAEGYLKGSNEGTLRVWPEYDEGATMGEREREID